MTDQTPTDPQNPPAPPRDPATPPPLPTSFIPGQNDVQIAPGIFVSPNTPQESRFLSGHVTQEMTVPPQAPLPFFPQLPDKPIPFSQAQQVFDRLASMQDIAFGYPQDGCYARAHLMCTRLLDDQHTPSKAWAFEGDNARLFVRPPGGGDPVSWWYHVAPTLPVEMPDGSVQHMVFDPSLFDGPATQNRWGQVMRADADKVSIVPLGAPPPRQYGDYNPSQKTTLQAHQDALDTMQRYLPQQNPGPRNVFASDLPEQVARAQRMAALSPADAELMDHQAARAFETRHGITGISGDYKLPGGVDPVTFDKGFVWKFEDGKLVTPPMLADKGLSLPAPLPDESAFGPLSRASPEVTAVYKQTWDNMVELNPSLKDIKVNTGNAAELYHATNGVASGLNTNDINFFLERSRGNTRYGDYFHSSDFTKIEDDFNTRPTWIAAPETLKDIHGKLSGTTPDISLPAEPVKLGLGGTTAGTLGIGMGVMGLTNAINTGDKVEAGIATANIGVSTVQTAEGIANMAGKTLPMMKTAGKFVPGLNAAITTADGVYQISKETTTEHKVERGVAVAATATTALTLGTAAATAGEAAAITTGVTTVLGTGAAATGTAAVAVAAAPVVLTAVAVGAVAYTGEKVIEAKRAWDDVDTQIAQSGAAQKRANYKSDDGKPSVIGYRHIAVALLQHSEDMKNENMNGTANLPRDAKGRFKIQDFKKIDMRDPKNIAELERVLDANIKKQDEILKNNRNMLDTVLPKWMAHGSDTLDKITMAQMERADLAGAMQELQMYRQDLKNWDAAHPNDPATTAPAAAQPPKARAKGPGG